MPFSKRVNALTGGFKQERARRQDIQARADAERARVFDVFNPILSEIRSALEEAEIGKVWVEAPSGGNGEFYHATTGNESVGRGNDRTWLFQCSVNAALETERKSVQLMGGFNVGIKNREDEDTPLHDIYAPVLAAAGYIVKTRVFDGERWPKSYSLLWGDTDSFFFGQPSEEAVTHRLISGLRENLRMAVQRFIETFEAAGF